MAAYASTFATWLTPGRARPTARRLIANCQHSGLGCSHAPLPGMLRRASTTTSVSPESVTATARRNKWFRAPTFLHPIHVRTATLPPATSRSACTCRAALAFCAKGVLAFGIEGVRAVEGPVASILPRHYTADLNSGRVGNDVDPPSGQLRGQSSVLPFLANRQRQLIIGDNHLGGPSGLIEDRD